MDGDIILEDLNEQQRQAVRHFDGPLLIVAGAGSGKTRVITRRVAYLISQGVSPQNIAAITFTNKAAREMLTRVRTTLDRYAGNGTYPAIATFHAFSAQLLRVYGRAVGIDPSFSILDQTDRAKLIKAACGDAGALPVGLTANKVTDRIAAAKGKMIGPDQLDRFTGLPEYQRGVIARIYRRYQERLRDNGGLDFDDLLIRTVELLDAPDAGEAIRRKYRYLLIDEYQDTNPTQYLIARKLAGPARNICATGDPDQAIYGWRGADIRNILEFQQDYPDAVVVFLEKNYRSTATILQAADSVINHNRQRKPKTLRPVHDQGVPIEIHTADDEIEEARQVVDIIRQARQHGTALSETAVFCRVNSLLRSVEQALIEADIPYELARGTGFFQRKEIKDLVSYLRVAVNDDDQLALERIINTPARGIGVQAQTVLKDFVAEQHITLAQALRRAGDIARLGKSQPSVVRFAALLDKLTRLKTTISPSEFTRAVIDLSGLGVYYQKQSRKDDRPDELSPRANLDEFVSVAATFESTSPEPTLAGFLAEACLATDVDTVTDDADRVTLLTMHAAKGLEFEVVVVIAAEEDIIPHALALPEHIEEERRLFFVAMTRAKRQLHLSCTHRRSTRGSYKRAMPSRFLKEIDPKTVKDLDLSAFDKSPRSVQFVINPRKAPDQPAPTAPKRRCPYRCGQRIYHKTFGYGIIDEIHLSGGRYMGSIRFHTAGVKKIALDLAPLQAVELE